jgi:hypothetical protein
MGSHAPDEPAVVLNVDLRSTLALASRATIASQRH